MDGEEMMHNGFMKVFRHLHKFEERHEKGFEYWIKKIMVNECLMYLRKNHNFKLISMDEVNENDLINQGYSETIDAEACFSVLNNLPVGYRTVFNLYTIEGYSHHEISELLGIMESTSRSQLSKARKILQQKIFNQKDSLYA
jgi:RNA polymerase sigma-70 factor (ECF subfamily)